MKFPSMPSSDDEKSVNVKLPIPLLQIATSKDLHRVLTADQFAVKLIEFLGPEADAPPSPLSPAWVSAAVWRLWPAWPVGRTTPAR